MNILPNFESTITLLRATKKSTLRRSRDEPVPKISTFFFFEYSWNCVHINIIVIGNIHSKMTQLNLIKEIVVNEMNE